MKSRFLVIIFLSYRAFSFLCSMYPAYGMTKVVDGKRTWLTESETVARLFEMYEELKNRPQ